MKGELSAGETQTVQKVQILSIEMARIQSLAHERARAVDSKAGFLAVTAGILVTADTWFMGEVFAWPVAGLPLFSALAAIGFATLALKVRSRPSTDAQKLVSNWLDDETKTDAALAERLVRLAARDTAELEATTTRRVRNTKFGFYALLLSIAATGGLYIVGNSII